MANSKKKHTVRGIQFHEDGISLSLDAVVDMLNGFKESMGQRLELKVKPDGKIGYCQSSF